MMATRDEVAGELERLVLAFPNQELNERTAAIYAAEMALLPAARLHQAVTEIIRESLYFPRVAEIRRRALQYSPPPGDYLWSMVQDLKDRALMADEFLAAEWQRVADQLAGMGKEVSAEYVRRKAVEYGSLCGVEFVKGEAVSSVGNRGEGDSLSACDAPGEVRGMQSVVGGFEGAGAERGGEG